MKVKMILAYTCIGFSFLALMVMNSKQSSKEQKMLEECYGETT